MNPDQARYIIRSKDHHYTFDGVTFPGVTSVVKVLDKSGPMMHWAARMTAEAAVAMGPALVTLKDTVGDDAAVKALMARREVVNEAAKVRGTDVHDMADRIATGQSLGPMAPDVLKRVDLYGEWLRGSGWTVRASEFVTVNPAKGYGGTGDLLARDQDGRTVLADLKTGNVAYRGRVYPEIVLQLGAYGAATWIETEAGLFAMPAIDRYVVIQVRADAVETFELTIGPAELAAFDDCLRLTRWLAASKARAA